MAIRESDLNTIQDIAVSDFARAVTNEGSSRKVSVANLAKTIIENYSGSSIGGSNQSIKEAVDIDPAVITLYQSIGWVQD